MKMINNILSFPAVNEVPQIAPAPDVPREVAGASPASQASNNDKGQADLSGQQGAPREYYMLRLTIDKDPDTGGWVYKAIDRSTGEVVSELPHKTLMQMRKEGRYEAGTVINTEA